MSYTNLKIIQGLGHKSINKRKVIAIQSWRKKKVVRYTKFMLY